MTLTCLKEILSELMPLINIILAILNVLIAYYLLKETRKLREAETYPEIIVSLEKSLEWQALYDIVVRNIGKGSAYNINFSFDPHASIIDQKDSSNINHLPFFKGISFFSPNQEYRSFFGDPDSFSKTPSIPLIIKVDYKNNKNKKFTHEYLIDPLVYSQRNWILRKTTNDFFEELKTLREIISDINDSLKSK